jgi:hypothetical protein
MPKRKFNRIRTLVARQPKCEAIVAYGVALQPHFFDARLKRRILLRECDDLSLACTKSQP